MAEEELKVVVLSAAELRMVVELSDVELHSICVCEDELKKRSMSEEELHKGAEKEICEESGNPMLDCPIWTSEEGVSFLVAESVQEISHAEHGNDGEAKFLRHHRLNLYSKDVDG